MRRFAYLALGALLMGIFTGARSLAAPPVHEIVATEAGARGDGRTDDTDALNAALEKLRDNRPTGGVLILPAGTYLTSKPLRIFSNVVVRGAGRNVTILHVTERDGVGIVTNFPQHTSYAAVENLTIEMKHPGTGILIGDNSFNNRFSNLNVNGAGHAPGSAGVLIQVLGAVAGSYWNTLQGVTIQNFETGVRLFGPYTEKGLERGTKANANHIIDGKIIKTKIAIDIAAGGENYITGTSVDNYKLALRIRRGGFNVAELRGEGGNECMMYYLGKLAYKNNLLLGDNCPRASVDLSITEPAASRNNIVSNGGWRIPRIRGNMVLLREHDAEHTGRLGIGTSEPKVALDVVGDEALTGCLTAGAGTGSVTRLGACPSDQRLKKDVAPIVGALPRIAALRPVRFRWKKTGVEESGLIAQEAEKVFPALVSTGADGFKRVSYGGELLMQTIQALRELKEEKDHELASARQELTLLREAVGRLRETVCVTNPGADGCRPR